jgi:hypothetical protein
MSDEQKPQQGQDSLSKLKDAAAELFGGFLAKSKEQGIRPEGAKNSFKLRYTGGAEREVFDDEIDAENLPTVKESFVEYAKDLGFDSGREATYRDLKGVVDGSSKVEWGKTYVAAIARATKG